MKKVGIIKQINRFPVKSMQGEAINESPVYWYGLDGDRRYAFVRSESHSNFPWLTGRQIPKLLLYQPRFTNLEDVNSSAVRVETPNGRFLSIHDPDLRTELCEVYGQDVHLIKIGRGAFDAQVLSLMSEATGEALSQQMGGGLDINRFRINLIVETESGQPFEEEQWLDSQIIIGSQSNGVRVRLNRRIQRCTMINIHSETAVVDHQMLRYVAQERDNGVGVYASPETVGVVRVGDAVYRG